MLRIDTHQHVVPPRYAEWMRASLPEVADPSHITYGSDFPFAPPVAVGSSTSSTRTSSCPRAAGDDRSRQFRGAVPPPAGMMPQ